MHSHSASPGTAKFKTPADKELMDQIQAAAIKPFVECNGSYYLAMQMPTLTCGDVFSGHRDAKKTCIIVHQYADQKFAFASALSHADGLNGVERKERLLMGYTASRAREIADGVWGQ